MRKLIKESGLRDISALRKRYPKAEIYFHQDLDGVTTAIAMKKYLEDNGIDVVDTHVIQYGDKEFSVKKNDAQGDTMPVLVDFAHGKPMFVIHTDHHDRQAGAEDTKSTSFRPSRSNVETISQVVSPKDIFPSSDILLISTVDSADFAKYDLSEYLSLDEKFYSFMPDTVIHCAWQGGNSSKDTSEIWQSNNIIANNNILKLCSKFKINHFIGFGSSAEFGYFKEKFNELE